METSTISTKGQVVIPKSIRRALNLSAGTKVYFEQRGSTIAIVPVAPAGTTTIDEVAGSLTYAGKAKTLADMEAAIAEGARQHGRD